jgi:DNA-nicking Smr family endonuclease
MRRASDLRKKTSKWSYTPFEGLKDAPTIRSPRPAQKASPSASRSPSPGHTDEEVFHKAMADVREIREFREIPPRKPPKCAPPTPEPDGTLEALREIRKISLPDTSEYAEWVKPRLRKDIARRLHEGDFSVQDYIDLHGMGLGEAEEAFGEFFREAVRKKLFCIKVIHGRGLRSPNGPILREALRKWLHGPYGKWVSAYATARDCDGGLGATYILLKGR